MPMDFSVTQESFDSLALYQADPNSHLNWSSVFVLPSWLRVWWQNFGSGFELYLAAVRQGGTIIGIAPLMINERTVSVIGSANVCDYLDFIVAPGKESDFFSVLLGDLQQKGIKYLDLGPLRPDSTVLTHFIGIAREQGYEVSCHQEDVSSELDLPPTWEEYLMILSKKQRHEVRRKLRRLWEADNTDYNCVEVSQEKVADFMDTFFRLFSLSREEKANFMTPQMESFFRSLARAMAEVGLLRVGIVELDKLPVAIAMGFDYNKTMYLYNSAYDPQYNSLSVGLLCKVLCLKESIQSGKEKWDFLKGGESYKYHIGGIEIPLSRCLITLR